MKVSNLTRKNRNLYLDEIPFYPFMVDSYMEEGQGWYGMLDFLRIFMNYEVTVKYINQSFMFFYESVTPFYTIVAYQQDGDLIYEKSPLETLDLYNDTEEEIKTVMKQLRAEIAQHLIPEMAKKRR